MTWRVLTFFFSQALGALLGWFVGLGGRPELGALVGLFCASALCFFVDLSRGARLLRWLRVGNSSEPTVTTGLWGEVSDRSRRAFRILERDATQSDARLQDFLAALQASPNGVVLLDEQGRIEWFNRMAARHFGLESQRDLGQHFANLVRDPGFAAYYAERGFDRAVVMPGRESSASRPVKLSVQLHPYGIGRSLLLSTDITSMEQADAMRRDFVANVSHEIRTPLTVMSGFVETLQSLPLELHEQHRYLDLMAVQTARMQTLVNDLLMLSRLEGSAAPSDTDWLPATTLAEQVQQEAKALAALLDQGSTAPLHLGFDAVPAIEIAGSFSELISAMGNLVSNAIRYTPPGGQIQLKYALLSDGRFCFSVQDTGPGIAPEHIPRLTERFYRVDRSRSRDTGGTGLGLAIVKHVVQRHGADLRIDSHPGLGSTFSITLPAQRVRQIVSG